MKHIPTAITAALTCLAAPLAHAAHATPFAPASQPSGDTLFTKISAADSGIHVTNNYDDPAMWGRNYQEFQGGAVGTGIAAGDIDGDGLADLYVVSKASPNKLFRQVAPFKFEDITASANVPGGSTWGTGATFADVDNDGDLDIYVCQFAAPNLLYVNDGKGVFTESAAAAGIDATSGSVVGAFEDYDRDGDLDLFLLTNVLSSIDSPEGEPDYLYRNNGDGTFTDVTSAAGIDSDKGKGHSATWWDADSDGWSDLYISNDFEAPDHLYKNNGDGTFTDITEIALPHTAWYSMGADYGDINNDGQFDFLAADMASTTHFKSKVTMGDMGGWVDHFDKQITPQYMKNALYLNTGTHRFMEVAKLTGLSKTDWTWSTRFEDFDNDGWIDLHVTNGMVRSFTDSDMINKIKTLKSQRQIIGLIKNSPTLAEKNLAFRNDGAGALHFSKATKDWGLDHEGVSFGSVAADFDNDGDLDLAYANFEDTVSLYRNDTQGNSLTIELEGKASNSHGIGAQITVESSHGTQIRKLTVARGVLSSSQPIAHFGLGQDKTAKSITVRWPSGAVQHLHNVASGQRLHIQEPITIAAVAIPPAKPIKTELAGLFSDQASQRGLDFTREEETFNDMTRQSLLPHRMNQLGGGIALGDADGDNDSDIYFAGAAGQTGALYLNDGNGNYTRDTTEQPWNAKKQTEEMAPLWIDANQDGHLDLYVTSGGVESDEADPTYQDNLYLNDGHGHFTETDSSHFSPVATSAATVTAADYDHDGDLDLFVGGRVIPGQYPKSPRSQLLENQNGTLVDVTEKVATDLAESGMITAALWSDINGDSWPDLITLAELAAPRVYLNNKGTLTDSSKAAGVSDYKGWWNSITSTDIDNDGDTDYILGNIGLNTKYKASMAEPFNIFYADFEGEGNCNIIEAKFENGNLLPERGRSCSSRAMPSLAEKFPTFHAFGTASLESVYSQDKLDNALTMEATELGHGIFLNDGHGHLTFTRLPRIAQASPVYGIAAADFDGDGNTDLVLAQNFSGPQTETGRYDGGIGLLLKGNGNGTFTPATAAESGILITDEARGLAIADLNNDGHPDLLATRPNNTTLAYVNQTPKGSHSVSISLKSNASANPNAIGARILATMTDGTHRSYEITSGSAYLTQSESKAFIAYTTANSPVSLEVTWPNGTSTNHSFDKSKIQIELLQSETVAQN